MDIRATLDADCTPRALHAIVADLGTYPTWLDIVTRAEPVVGGDGEATWDVVLRARIGPLARSKRLRMVRTVDDPPTGARFERRDADGRDHAAWVLDVDVAPLGAHRSRLTMDLHYGGSLWLPLLDRLLGAEIESSRARLLDLVERAGD